MFGFYRIAAAVPKLRVADPAFNTQEILRCAEEACREGAEIAVFPELCISGYTCGDLFHQSLLLSASWESLLEIAESMKHSSILMALGLPVHFRSKLYNCAAMVYRGKILSLTPKIFLPNQREFYEKRHFSSGTDILNRAVYTGS